MNAGKNFMFTTVFCILGLCIAAVSAEDVNGCNKGYAGFNYYENEGEWAENH